MKKLAILGAGGHGKVVADAAECSGWQAIHFYDDQVQAMPTWDIVGNFETLLNSLANYDGVIVAIGDNRIRLARTEILLAQKAPLISIIHPHSSVSRHSKIDVGTVVLAGGIINPGATIGVCCIINTGATVDHDCNLGKAVHISPGAHCAGGVFIDDLSWVGIGACIKDNIRIGKHVIIGAGAAVVRNLPDNLTAIGVPARKK